MDSGAPGGFSLEERVEKHIYQYVEAELRNYRIYKKLIEEYDKELEYTGAKSGLAKDPTGRFPKNLTSDPTHTEAVRIIANEHRIQRAKDMVACIEDVLAGLSREDRMLIELKYFQGWLTDFGIIRQMNISRSTYYRNKARIIKQFALRMRLF